MLENAKKNWRKQGNSKISSDVSKFKVNSSLPKFSQKNSQKVVIKRSYGKAGWKSGSGLYCNDGNAYLTGGANLFKKNVFVESRQFEQKPKLLSTKNFNT